MISVEPNSHLWNFSSSNLLVFCLFLFRDFLMFHQLLFYRPGKLSLNLVSLVSNQSFFEMLPVSL